MSLACFAFLRRWNHQAEGLSYFNEGLLNTQLSKWDLLRGMKYYQFRYDKFYHKGDVNDFTRDFFDSSDVCQALGMTQVNSYKSTILKASVTSMSFFDKLLERTDIIRSTGQIVKCMDDYHYGFHVQDTLRDVLLNEDNEIELENGHVFTEDEKEEFLFVIFKHLAIGGSLCQFEVSY